MKSVSGKTGGSFHRSGSPRSQAAKKNDFFFFSFCARSSQGKRARAHRGRVSQHQFATVSILQSPCPPSSRPAPSKFASELSRPTGRCLTFACCRRTATRATARTATNIASSARRVLPASTPASASSTRAPSRLCSTTRTHSTTPPSIILLSGRQSRQRRSHLLPHPHSRPRRRRLQWLLRRPRSRHRPRRWPRLRS
jgi:hypothetical protein